MLAIDDGAHQDELSNVWVEIMQGRFPLFDIVGDSVQIFHLSIQEYLAARHAWALVDNGEQLPLWTSQEGENNNFAIGFARFFGYIATWRTEQADQPRTKHISNDQV